KRRKWDRHRCSPATGLLSSPVSAFPGACHGLYRKGANYPGKAVAPPSSRGAMPCPLYEPLGVAAAVVPFNCPAELGEPQRCTSGNGQKCDPAKRALVEKPIYG